LNDYKMMVDAYKEAGGKDVFSDSDVAHIVLERDKVLGQHMVEGLEVDAKRVAEGNVAVKVRVREGYKIEKPVHMCFGVLPKEGKQKIDMDIEIEDNASVEIMSDCVFPNAIKVVHEMLADIYIGKGSSYIYRENHFHGEDGGVTVNAKSDIKLEEDSNLKTVFSLLKGRAGNFNVDYDSEVKANATIEMVSKIKGYVDDKINIREGARLIGEGARGLLESKIAIQDEAVAEVYNELTASANEAKGHVDCTEIIKDNASARAIPIVNVKHSGAKVTHEAAIGSVDSTQLQTLMARGLNEEEATDVIVEGLLNG